MSSSSSSVFVPVVTPCPPPEGHTCLYLKDHGRRICESLQALRLQSGLLDLDIVCEDQHVRAHKIVMAAASTFFRDQLCKANVLVPVILRLEDFGVDVRVEALTLIVEFVYQGEVVVTAEKMTDVCTAAHALGITGLIDFLPNSARSSVDEVAAAVVHEVANNGENHQQQQQVEQQEAIHHVVVSAPSVLQQTPLTLDPSADVQMVQQQAFSYDPTQQHQGALCDSSQQQATYNASTGPIMDYAGQIVSLEEDIILENNFPHNLNEDINSSSGMNNLTAAPSATSKNKQWNQGKLRVISQGKMMESNNVTTNGSSIDAATAETSSSTSTKPSGSAASNNSNMPGTSRASLGSAWTVPNAVVEIDDDAGDNEEREDQAGEERVSWTLPQEENQAEETLRRRNSPQQDADDSMLAIRSGVPLALQNKRKRKKLKDFPLKISSKKGDLGVRKDLTLPSAPTPGEDNVFRDDCPGDIREFPVIELDDGDCELIIHGSGEAKNGYQCVECTMEFGQENQLRQHVKHAHQKEESLFCPVCKVGDLKGKEQLKIHLYKDHALGELFRCEDCNFETAIKGQYLRHQSTHHQQQQQQQNQLRSQRCSSSGVNAGASTDPSSLLLTCEICGKRFKTRTGLKMHVNYHLDQQLFQCPECPFKNPQKSNLAKHMATKHQKNLNGTNLKAEIKCKFCDFVCIAEYQLKYHLLRKHTSRADMPFKCPTCDYASVEKAAVEKHIRCKHTNERPYECNLCGFSTHTLSSLARHKRCHTNSKPYKCDECNLSYADKKRLRDHKLKHSGELPFKCQHCDFKSRRKDHLKSHLRRLHPAPDTVVDRSHIVAHVNQDGTIQPVSSSATAQEPSSSSSPAKSSSSSNIQDVPYFTKQVASLETPGVTEEVIVIAGQLQQQLGEIDAIGEGQDKG